MRRRTSTGKDKKSLLDSCGDITFILCSVSIRYFVRSDEDRHGTVVARLSAGFVLSFTVFGKYERMRID